MEEPTNIELKDNECALVINADNWGVEFYLPKYKDDDNVPYSVVLLSVIAGLLSKQEPKFMKYMDKIAGKIMHDIDKGDENESN